MLLWLQMLTEIVEDFSLMMETSLERNPRMMMETILLKIHWTMIEI